MQNPEELLERARKARQLLETSSQTMEELDKMLADLQDMSVNNVRYDNTIEEVCEGELAAEPEAAENDTCEESEVLETEEGDGPADLVARLADLEKKIQRIEKFSNQFSGDDAEQYYEDQDPGQEEYYDNSAEDGEYDEDEEDADDEEYTREYDYSAEDEDDEDEEYEDEDEYEDGYIEQEEFADEEKQLEQ